MSNSWPDGYRHAMYQSEHAAWNSRNYPGTRQLCDVCGCPTGRCEDDTLSRENDEDDAPLCEDCWEAEQQATDVANIVKACLGLIEILEGDSGTGASYWEQDPRYIAAKKAIKEFINA